MALMSARFGLNWRERRQPGEMRAANVVASPANNEHGTPPRQGGESPLRAVEDAVHEDHARARAGNVVGAAAPQPVPVFPTGGSTPSPFGSSVPLVVEPAFMLQRSQAEMGSPFGGAQPARVAESTSGANV